MVSKSKKKKDPHRFLPKLQIKLAASDTTGNMYLSWDKPYGYSYAKLTFIDQLKTIPVRVEGKEDEIIRGCCWVKPDDFNLAETEVYIRAFNENDKLISKPTSSKDAALDGKLKMEVFNKLKDTRKSSYVDTW